MLKIICIGKLKENYLKEAQDDYLKRLNKYAKIELIELLDSNDVFIPKALSNEAERIKKALNAKDNIILLDIKGQMNTSEEFSELINKELTINSNITFIIGSSNGVADEIKDLAKKKVSISKATFPHQFFRIMLLEQIYRSFKIINNETYHK